MRPTFQLAAEWQAEASGIEWAAYDAGVRVPFMPVFGPPPPFIHLDFSYTDLDAPPALDLPSDLFDYAVGFSWMRPLNERWLLRFMASAALATDGRNQSRDAWRFRGHVFGIYRPHPRWTWVFGALALGRNDLPVVPAIGAIWQAKPELRLDFTLPKPRVTWLVVDRGSRQQWAYVGGEWNGSTWGIERVGRIDDQLTYRDWRVVVGWESLPAAEPGMPPPRGRKLGFEVGYVFARRFEFESGMPDIALNDALLVRVFASF